MQASGGYHKPPMWKRQISNDASPFDALGQRLVLRGRGHGCSEAISYDGDSPD